MGGFSGREDRARWRDVCVLALVLLMMLGLAPGCRSGKDKGAAEASGRTSADGGGAASLVNGGYRLDAGPGTFAAGSALDLRPTSGHVPGVGKGRLLLPPVEVTAPGQPSRPVTVETVDPQRVDPSTTWGLLWTGDGGRYELLPVDQLADGRLRTRLPHFSSFGLFTFPSPIDLSDWIAQELGKGLIDYVRNFLDAPYDCPPPTFSSARVDSQSYPTGSINLQLDMKDHPTQTDTITAELCNRLRFAMTYGVEGAAAATGFSLPRSTLRFDLHLRGQARDPLAVKADFGAAAVTATTALVAVEVLAPSVTNGTAELVFNDKVISAIVDSTRSCASSIDAMLASSSPDSMMAAWSCLKQLESFKGVVIDLYTTKLLKLGLLEAGAKAPPVAAILGGQALNRVIAELATFDIPRPVVFSYRVRCSTGAPCPARGSEPDPAATDWSNRQYRGPRCGGSPQDPLVVDVREGKGRSVGDRASIGGHYDVTVDKVVSGDISGDRRAETVVLMTCVPTPGNFSVQELFVFDERGERLGSLPAADGLTSPDRFDPASLSVGGGRIVADADRLAPGQCRACGPPSLHVTYTWTWTGTSFDESSTTRTDATPTTARQRVDTGPSPFLSPSRNIGCNLTSTHVRCDIAQREWQPPPKPSDCTTDWGHALSVTGQALGQFRCAGDTVIAGGSQVLPYGQVARRGPFECRSEEGGMECVNLDTGHGIALSRTEYRVF